MITSFLVSKGGYVLLWLLFTIWLQDKLQNNRRFGSALEWIAVDKLGVSALLHILDDFLLISKSKEEAITNLSAFINLCEDIGVPLSAAKTELPSQIMDFVGITLDIQKQETRLPIDNLKNATLSLINIWIWTGVLWKKCNMCLFGHPARACLLEKND